MVWAQALQLMPSTFQFIISISEDLECSQSIHIQCDDIGRISKLRQQKNHAAVSQAKIHAISESGCHRINDSCVESLYPRTNLADAILLIAQSVIAGAPV